MKRYISRAAKPLAAASLICCAIFMAGIALLFATTEYIAQSIGLIAGGGLFGILFLTCFAAEKSRVLMIDGHNIIFPRGAEINGTMIFRKTVIGLDEITSVESTMYKGDGLISKDTYFYTLKFKDGRKVTVTLYAYGKEAEKEILEAIKKNSP